MANAGHKPLDTRIFQKEAKSLHRGGWEVTLLIPHHESFEKDGIHVIHVPLPKKGWEQLIRCPWNLWRKALRQPRQAIFHIHDAELLMVGLALRCSGRRVIYDAHEDTPLQISYQHWIPWLVKKPYAWFYFLVEKLAGVCFDAIIVAEPVIARYFPSRKVTLIRNFPIAADFSAGKPYPDRSPNLVYVGLLSRPRGVEEMLEAHHRARNKVTVEFVLGGKFAPASLEEELLSKYQVRYRSWMPYPEMVSTLGEARVGIIVPHPIKRYLTNYPVKLFEYMAAGIPVIAARDAESSTFVDEGKAGILVDPLNVDEIADAIVELIANPAKAEAMGMRGRKLIQDVYNWETESVKLIQLYESLS